MNTVDNFRYLNKTLLPDVTLAQLKLLYVLAINAHEQNSAQKTYIIRKSLIERVLGLKKMNMPDLQERLGYLHGSGLFRALTIEPDIEGGWLCRYTISDEFFQLFDFFMLFESLDEFAETAGKLGTKRSFLLYLFLLAKKDENVDIISVEDLRTVLDAEDCFSDYKELNRAVIQKGIHEINEKLAFEYTFEPCRFQNRICSFRYSVKQPVRENKAESMHDFLNSACDNRFTEAQIEEIYILIRDRQFESEPRGHSAALYDYLHEQYIRLRRYAEKSDKIKDEFAYFLSMLKNDKG